MSGDTDTLAPTPEPQIAEVKTRVVLVDARPDRRAVMRQVFEHSGVDAAVVAEADTGADAVPLVGRHGAQVVVVELPTPLADGLAVIGELQRQLPHVTIVVISFAGDSSIKEKALAAGADAYLVKPVSAREIVAAVPITAPLEDVG